MREILFRGKRIDNGGWVYGVPVVGKTSGVFMVWIEAKSKSSRNTLSLRDVVRQAEVIPETVGQDTGLKDKNGVEIYEGDIVVQDGYIWFDEGKPNYRGTVEWIYSQWQVIAHCVNPDKRGISDGMNYGLNDECFGEGENSDWEVIGNIYDNIELML